MPEIIPGPDTNPYHSYIKPITTREELSDLLVRASELEHSLACASLFALYSLKNDASEGGLTETQASMVRGWRRCLMTIAAERMFNLFQISNLLAAIGASSHIARPIFPLSMGTDAAEDGLSLEPFSVLTIERLVAYSSEATQANSATYVAIEDLYNNIALGFRSLPAKDLFVKPVTVALKLHFLDREKALMAVVDQNTAISALAMITGGGNETASSDPEMLLTKIGSEYATASASAQQSGQPFVPVRPVGKNPSVQLHEDVANYTPIVASPANAVADLFNEAYDTLLILLQHFFVSGEETDVEQLLQATRRLMNTVVRPLGEALTRLPVHHSSSSLPDLYAGAPFADSCKDDIADLAQQASIQGLLDERLWQMATAATRLAITPGIPTEVVEAAAALQDLACQFAPAEGSENAEAKVLLLQHIQAGAERVVQSSINGPYLASNVESLKTWLGESIPTRPLMALCRCGSSSTKPFCDGTHANIDFASQKDPSRVPDHRDTYVGTAITVFDNRGICAHSGFCTDRLSSAFHAGKEPFVTPSGARLDEIVRAVRSCPSGALSYAIGDVEAREQVDQQRPPSIEISKDGPYRITGWIPLKDGQGEDEARNEGSSKEHYSLCRCGHSKNKPFCSGMHWYVNFHDPVVSEDHDPTLFEWVGGLPALTRMTHIFYEKYVPQDPLLNSLFANMAPDHPERVAAWLGEVFGGPKSYSGTYGGYSRMISQHIGKQITEEKRARWATLIGLSADEAGLPADPEFRSAFSSYIEWGSRLAVENSTAGAHPPLHMPMPHWNWGTAGLPSSRVSALAPVATVEKEVPLPSADEVVHFTQHIKPLFRSTDRQSMKWIFDLWEYADVKKYADAILQRLQNGTMPCDCAWPHEKVEAFQRWIKDGTLE